MTERRFMLVIKGFRHVVSNSRSVANEIIEIFTKTFTIGLDKFG